MGSGASGPAENPGADLRLPTTGLRFTVHQLRALNSYVDMLHEENQKGRMPLDTENIMEDIVQRIVDGAGQKDPRFKCYHLIALHRHKMMRSRSLEYLVTLDSLPVLNDETEECRLRNGPLGYGKVSLSGREAEKWAEFITPCGFLCRDKIVERWVQLAAKSARAKGGGGCRVLCAKAAARTRPMRYCYLQRTSQNSTPERRLAIVEGAAWVMVRVGAGEAEAKLVLGVRVGGTNPHLYTTRVPLTHPMAMLHYTAAQGGYYAVAIGPSFPTPSSERGIYWQLWQPSLEATLDTHFSDQSTVARVAGALNALIDHMRDTVYEGCQLLLSRYIAWCALQRRLLTVGRAQAFRSTHAAHHLLLVMDTLVGLCEREGTVGLVFPVGRESFARKGSISADWSTDAACLRRCLIMLHGRAPAAGEEIPKMPSELLETALFSRWESLNKESKALSYDYSKRQLLYLSRVADELLNFKNMTVYEDQKIGVVWAEDGIERLVHILAIALDQARDTYLDGLQTSNPLDRDLMVYRSRKWNRLREYYDASSACLIDAVRRDPNLRDEDLADGFEMMRNVIGWLRKAVKQDKKHLAPVLNPYLEAMFVTSLENCWFSEEFESRQCDVEYRGLEAYCAAVHREDVEPSLGLLEAAKKYAWAKAMVDFLDRFRLVEFRLVFPTGDGLAISFPVKLRAHQAARRLALSGRDKADAKLRLANRCVVDAFHDALIGERGTRPGRIREHASSDEILNSMKAGQFWRSNNKPDIIPFGSQELVNLDSSPRLKPCRRSESYRFPEISITDQSDTKTLRRKYHTLKNLVYTEPVESIKDMKRHPRSASSTLRRGKALSRPTILETLDFINGIKDSLYVEESGASEAEDSWSAGDEWLLGQTAPPNFLAGRSAAGALHAYLGDLVPALLQRARFTVLQELCSFLGESSEGALFALHRLARAARSKNSERLPEKGVNVGGYLARYRKHEDCDTPPQPPPLPRRRASAQPALQVSEDAEPSIRIKELEDHVEYLQQVQTRLNMERDPQYTGVINPPAYVKIQKDKFAVKRSKSLGRPADPPKPGLEARKTIPALETQSSRRTNDVVLAIRGTSKASGLFRRCVADKVVGGSYKPTKISVD